MKKSIYILALGAFGIITTEFGVIGILPTISREFQVSIDTAGWLLSAFALTVAISSPFLTALTAKINRKFLLCLVLSVFVLSNVISAFAPNFTILMIARILPAFLHPLFWNISLAVAFKQGGAKAVSIVMTGLSLATVLGVPITTYAVEFFNNWQASFFLASFISLIAFLGLAFFVPNMPASKEKSSKNQFFVLRDPQLWVHLLSTVLTLAAMFSSYSYLAGYLEKITHMNGVQISMMLLLFGVMGILGNWLTGIALSKNITLASRWFLVLLISTQVLAYYYGDAFAPMVIILSIWGLIHTGGFLVPNIRTTHAVPHSALEFVNSLLTTCYNIGISLGAFLGGFVIAHYGIHQIVWMSIGLLSLTLIISFIKLSQQSKTEEGTVKEPNVSPAICEQV
ncbi:MFS transporter [Pedobacter caeni]|uniref:Predicted arabinose efflux permease, MFS family n=1 Tax=Pedobacter caeni TaxID=288992 RepID=A0A1M4UIJ3_9SPHI|nr:MFS transporter [Pedobacter caeni]SHE56581.1 Predicted arabinose efflux permease, MFS family [Pedobacter caeni]